MSRHDARSRSRLAIAGLIGSIGLLLAGCATAPATGPLARQDMPVGTAAPVAATGAAAPGSAAVPATNSASVSVPIPTPIDAAARLEAFRRWVDAFRDSARQAGISEATLQQGLDGVSFLPRVVELDQAQPEFTRSVWSYLDTAVTEGRVVTGQDRLRQWRAVADAAAARYGVPPEIVVAIWGMESNYGGNIGSTPTLDALATLGFDGRREDWARGQLLAALRILQNGDIDRAHMIGSWAGAMGQTQFLPSVFLAHAVDADGDGRRDIWGSLPDVIASTANFLAHSGWKAGQPWGVEVVLPAGFDVAQADAGIRLPSATWAAAGVRRADAGGSSATSNRRVAAALADPGELPAFADGSILLPAGARGPAFLVGPNFRTILRYNNSTSYALAVSLLAQRIAGGPGVQAAWPRDLVTLSRSQVLSMQTALNQRGFDTGTPDGLVGPATRDGLRRYQRSMGLPPDGYPTLDLLGRLLAP